MIKTLKPLIYGFVLASTLLIGSAISSKQAHAEETQEMYRLYNPNSGEHFYTANANEKSNLIRVGWRDENIGWVAPKTGNAVYRLYNPNSGEHHYTLSKFERDHLTSVGWRAEGVGWYSDVQKRVPLYRLYNPYAKAASHHYTKNVAEQRKLLSSGWKDEGIAWYGVPENTASNHSNQGTSTPPKENQTNTPTTPSNKAEMVTTAYGTKINLTKVKEIAFELVNKERTQNNLETLGQTNDTTKLADIRASELVTKFSHDRPNGQDGAYIFKEMNSTERFFGENITNVGILENSTEESLANQLFNNFKNSKAHYDIMMRKRSKYLGIGIKIDPEFKARLYVEFLFSR